MSSPFVAEIKMFAGNFPPNGYAFCNGQLLPISQNTALFSLLGTQFGGDGKSTFALPNLQDTTPIGNGQGPGTSDRVIGEQGGSPTITLLQTEIPVHNHNWGGSNNQGDQPVGSPAAVLAQSSPGQAYQTVTNANIVQFNMQQLSVSGGGLPHNNMMPYLAVTFIIALQGVFPPRS